MDNFENTNNEELKSNVVKYEDLIVAKKNGKSAIFNKEESYFITNHEYDRILLSESGHHIVYKADDLIDEEGHLLKNWGKITYSAIVDNYGNFKEFENLEFGYNGSFIGDVCPAFNKETQKVHLVDFNKGIISSGFSRITPVNKNNTFGLYYGLERNENGDLYANKLIYKDGTILPFTIDDNTNDWYFRKAVEITSIEILEKNIREYGSNIIELAPVYNFYTVRNFYKILTTVNEFYPEQINYTISILSKNIKHLKDANEVDLNFELKINSKPLIYANYIKKKLNDFLQKILKYKN